ncbi:MAG: ACT domain-containing protein [Anaerolineae bacterium]|nr:ACT domain-containing protein [Anaerolineae bacterium]
MTHTMLNLTILPERFAICKLDREERLPNWGQKAAFSSVTRTHDELSIICPEVHVPPGTICEKGWRAFKFEGPFEFDLIGILNSVTVPLAEAQISIFALSTYDTDYVLVKEAQLEAAISVLSDCGHVIRQLT